MCMSICSLFFYLNYFLLLVLSIVEFGCISISFGLLYIDIFIIENFYFSPQVILEESCSYLSLSPIRSPSISPDTDFIEVIDDDEWDNDDTWMKNVSMIYLLTFFF